MAAKALFFSSSLLLAGLAAAAPTSSSSANTLAARAAPALTVGMRWDYPLGYHMTAAKASPSTPFYSVDLFDTDAADIASMKNSNHYVACYFSAGTYENWRPDASQYPQSAIGNSNGWPGERWVDIRNSQVRTIIANRIALAQQKGCSGIDPDNTDGYSNKPGFPLTKQDSVDFIKWMCSQAAARGMKCGLKNTPDVIPDVLSVTSWVITEECAAFDECASYKPYIQSGKPVFHVEYDDSDDYPGQTDACAAGGQQGFSNIIKHLDLDEYIYQCP